jgi:molybdopterin converting factor small subunit
MYVNMLYFGVLKELFAVSRETVEVPVGTTVEGILSFSRERTSNLLKAGCLRIPGQVEIWSSLAVAVNREYADRTMVLRDGDEVALLPPVSGGCGEERRAA